MRIGEFARGGCGEADVERRRHGRSTRAGPIIDAPT
jgi:hypothetical protein